MQCVCQCMSIFTATVNIHWRIKQLHLRDGKVGCDFARKERSIREKEQQRKWKELEREDVNNHFVQWIRGLGCESIYITHTDSIYRSYNVFEAGVPFVSAVRALIIPRMFLLARLFSFSFFSSSPPPREPKWPLVLQRVHAASQVAGASDPIAVACLDNRG